MLEKKVLINQLEVKDFSEDKGEVAFYFSAFNNEDLGGDIIRPGATKKTVKEKGITIYHNRDHNHAVGKPQQFGEDSKGAFCVSQIALKTINGNDCYEQYKAGLITGHSMEYCSMQDKTDQNGTRTITELKLFGVTSVTNIPMNLDTPTISIKSFEQLSVQMKKINDFLHNGHNISDQIGEQFLIEYKRLEQMMKSLIEKKTAGSAATVQFNKPAYMQNVLGAMKQS